MKDSNIRHLILITVILSLILCACKQESVPKSNFGDVDVLSDGEILINGITEEDAEGSDEKEEEEAATSDSPIKTAKKLELDDLTPEITKMVALCDAINMTCVEQQKAYTADDPEFVWHCIHLYVVNCTDKEMGFKKVGDVVDASPSVVSDLIYAMFGKITAIPALPSLEGEGGRPHMWVSNDLKYRFALGDRGTSTSELRRVTQYSDGSLEMEVALVDSESGDETVSFNFAMRANTRNTTTSALFDYEITGVRPADKTTSDKMSGMPFPVAVMQVYGYDSYEEDDAKYNEVDEVLYFNSFAEPDEGIEELNARISHEILEYANAPLDDVSWHEICSYPLTTYDYVQVATTYITYPNYGVDPEIRTYNYSKDELRAMDKSDAMALCQMTEKELTDKVSGLWKPESDAESLAGVEYRGFLVRADQSVDVYLMIKVNNTEADPYSRLVVYNSAADEIRYAFEGEGIIPEDEEDVIKPKLTHGRKDK